VKKAKVHSVRNGEGPSRVNRQNSRVSENIVAKRHGDKVLNLYQQYINEGDLVNGRVLDGSPLYAEAASG
jgi:hypothetical protein